MTTMQELIDAHRRALTTLNEVTKEQGEAEALSWLLNKCEIELLIANAYEAGSNIGCVYGESEDQIRNEMNAAYANRGRAIYWIERQDVELYKKAIDILAKLQAKNLRMIRPRLKAWQEDRQKIQKRRAELKAQWNVAEEAERTAATALLTYHPADAEEEAARTRYVGATAIFFDDDSYARTLFASLYGRRERQPEAA